MFEMKVDFILECAHRTPGFPEDHPNSRLHGHTYYGEICLKSSAQTSNGFLRDVGEVKSILGPVVDSLDHRFLNDVPGLGAPSSENIAQWIYHKLKTKLPELFSVTIRRPSVQMSVTFFGKEG